MRCRTPLPAAGARVEVQVDGVTGRGDTDKVADIDSKALGRAYDVHVVRLYGEVQLAGLVQYVLAESFVGLILAVHATCNFFHVGLQLQVGGVDGSEQDAEAEQGGEYEDGRGDTPFGNGVHER